jgi:hypothetical protein
MSAHDRRAVDVVFRVASATVLATLVLACLAAARPAHDSSPARGPRAVLPTAAAEAPGDSVPTTPVPRLVMEPETKSEPGPALWVGGVMGISGLVGLVLSLVGRSRHGHP